MPSGGAFIVNQRVIETLDTNTKLSLLRNDINDVDGHTSQAHHLRSLEKIKERVTLLNPSETNPLITEPDYGSEKDITSIRSMKDGFFYQPDLIKAEASKSKYGQIKIDLKRNPKQ